MDPVRQVSGEEFVARLPVRTLRCALSFAGKRRKVYDGQAPASSDPGGSDDAAKLQYASAALTSDTAVFEKAVELDGDLVASLRWCGARSAAAVRPTCCAKLASHCVFLRVCRYGQSARGLWLALSGWQSSCGAGATLWLGSMAVTPK